MAEFSAADVAALRKATGAGMLDCKRALEESGGDVEMAKEWLRKKGLAGASRRAGRSAEQGAVEVLVEGNVGAVVELTAETDFVAKGRDVTETVARLARLAVDAGKDDLADLLLDGVTVGEHITQLAAKLGENIALGRIVTFETADGLLDGYKHVQNERGTIGVLVELGGVDPTDERTREVAHDLALHVSFAAPDYLTRDDVPAEVVEKEREVLEELTRNEGKPEAALPKIVEGRLSGFFKERVLLEQVFVRDQKSTVRNLLETLGPEASVRRFARIKIGDG
jgi:elongation factor Ts